jgi:hypothetical protein
MIPSATFTDRCALDRDLNMGFEIFRRTTLADRLLKIAILRICFSTESTQGCTMPVLYHITVGGRLPLSQNPCLCGYLQRFTRSWVPMGYLGGTVTGHSRSRTAIPSMSIPPI